MKKLKEEHSNAEAKLKEEIKDLQEKDQQY